MHTCIHTYIQYNLSGRSGYTYIQYIHTCMHAYIYPFPSYGWPKSPYIIHTYILTYIHTYVRRDDRATIGFPDNGLNASTTSLSIQSSKSIEMLPDIDNFEGGKKVHMKSIHTYIRTYIQVDNTFYERHQLVCTTILSRSTLYYYVRVHTNT